MLHHFDLARAAAELRRVLRPGGMGVFCEPWGENRWLRLARREFGYPGKDRTPDEEPLGVRDVAALRRVFPSIEVAGYQLLAMASRVLRRPALVRLLSQADDGCCAACRAGSGIVGTLSLRQGNDWIRTGPPVPVPAQASANFCRSCVRESAYNAVVSLRIDSCLSRFISRRRLDATSEGRWPGMTEKAHTTLVETIAKLRRQLGESERARREQSHTITGGAATDPGPRMPA